MYLFNFRDPILLLKNEKDYGLKLKAVKSVINQIVTKEF